MRMSALRIKPSHRAKGCRGGFEALCVTHDASTLRSSHHCRPKHQPQNRQHVAPVEGAQRDEAKVAAGETRRTILQRQQSQEV